MRRDPPSPSLPSPPCRSFDIPPRFTDQPMGGGTPTAFLQTSQMEQLNISHHATKSPEEQHWPLERKRFGGYGAGGPHQKSPSGQKTQTIERD
ncbi:hypothetical protein JOB18_004248 [Solea senegalensis]|uniref:Uncharacterized protein n=1 Tax=Solea senegalensis TaxID=28829 RepID=A0AAV6QDE4_SOLSE|nr:hypothetical protein JOB18_004248 [Solea senegalensis]